MIKIINYVYSVPSSTKSSTQLRLRSQSTVSLRKRMIRTSSEERGEAGELKKSATMTSFRPKLERLIQEGKIEQIMNQDPSSKAHLFYTVPYQPVRTT